MSGHTSPVECVAFDSAEVLVVAGASTGAIKLWDLEEAKIVRTLTGHRINCTAVEFHPFGEFFASGSLDANLKIWDIRKKGCIHTYKGHTRGISTIRFTPDGRWVVSGGLDNVVKVWDLTAGKLLHDFTFHEGRITCIDFHPLEFLLATGSADRTVKFWDLETFELIGSAGPEATGVRSMIFHPDGRTLFCGLEDGLKVFSWEPIICHDAVDMGWSTLADLCIHDGKLLGCSHHRNSVGVWVADTSFIGPYGVGVVPRSHSHMEQKFDLQENHSVQKSGSSIKSNAGVLSMPQDYDSKEIKNIYVDSSNGIQRSLQRLGSINSSKVALPLDSDENRYLSTLKKSPPVEVKGRTGSQVTSRPFTVPVVVPRNSPSGENVTNSRRESVISERSTPGMLLKPSHIRRLSNSKCDMERLPLEVESDYCRSKKSGLDDPNDHSKLVTEDEDTETCEVKPSGIRHVAEKFEKILTPEPPLSSKNENCDDALSYDKGVNSVKFVNGVAVVPGRTRSLVERFERRERCTNTDAPTTSPATPASNMIPETDTLPPSVKGESRTSGRESTSGNDNDIAEALMLNHEIFLSTLRSRLTKLQVVRHFWERKDIKGAINAMRKLPDHSVQADVTSALMEKMESVTLDLFSCLLPVLTSLLDSMTDRHTSVSLEMLLKLVTVFGPVIRSTLSASPSVGVDIQAEHRRECCKQCFLQLQKIKQVLPTVTRRGGLIAKCAEELHLVLQEL